MNLKIVFSIHIQAFNNILMKAFKNVKCVIQQ